MIVGLAYYSSPRYYLYQITQNASNPPIEKDSWCPKYDIQNVKCKGWKYKKFIEKGSPLITEPVTLSPTLHLASKHTLKNYSSCFLDPLPLP